GQRHRDDDDRADPRRRLLRQHGAAEAGGVAVEFLRFVRRALAAQFSGPPPRDEFVRHALDAGVGSLPLLTLLTVFAGMNLSVQAYGTFVRFGGQDLLGLFCGVGGIRELYPVMAAVICGARIGATLVASLAN